MLGLLRSPLAWIVIGGATTLVPIAIAGESGVLVSLFGLCLFSVAGPLVAALGAHWWRDTVLCIGAWMVIFVGLGQLPAVSALREGAMVFLLPMIVFPLALVVSGMIRLVRRRRMAGTSA